MQPTVPGIRLRPRSATLGRVFRIGLGVLAVAISAQVALPLGFTPIPFTLQPLAVILVGAVLGPVEGAATLTAYLCLGALGAPVFAGGGGGVLRLLGPTGGYLLAFPVAAAVAGYARSRTPQRPMPASVRAFLAMTVSMAIIHLGGVSQLAILGGDPSLAFRYGFLPFFIGDLVKVAIATAILALGASRLSALR